LGWKILGLIIFSVNLKIYPEFPKIVQFFLSPLSRLGIDISTYQYPSQIKNQGKRDLQKIGYNFTNSTLAKLDKTIFGK